MARSAVDWRPQAGWETVVFGGLEGMSLNDRNRLACEAQVVLMKELFVLLLFGLLGLSSLLISSQCFGL